MVGLSILALGIGRITGPVVAKSTRSTIGDGICPSCRTVTVVRVPVVATFPVWYLRTGPVFLERVWKALPDIGFEPVLPPGAESAVPEHPSFLYRRPDQFVGRQIVLLKPKK